MSSAKTDGQSLPTRYHPRDVESRWYEAWLQAGEFHSAPPSSSKGSSSAGPEKRPYCIVIPPPNVTGALHMGHALNNTLQDVLIRWRRMQGYETLWMPGTDHAGIATQSVVERTILKEEKKTRHDIGRDELLKRIWNWKDAYGERIVRQLHKLGSSCDWERARFTMDDGLSKAVREAFVRLYREGLIYRGRYLVNWCPKLRTALADDEVEHRNVKGHLWHIRYPVSHDPSRHVTVATTRPETMLGDAAVAVHPKDERYGDLVGKTLTLPLLGREIPVVADSHVDREFGTGAVKVTPAHDPNDFAIGERHGLEKINILNEDGTINENGGPYAGQGRFKARENVVADLEREGLLEKIEEHEHKVGHCYRTGDVIEPYLSLQWFVKMEPLAAKAIAATREGRVKFHPERWTSFYLQWLENVRDWCVSRQIWWGHQIPIWYGPEGSVFCAHDEAEALAEAKKQFGEGVELQRDPDVLDTWFSSALWPFSTLGWPDTTPELDYYYPTSTLVTDRGIIFFWVARMVMMGEAMLGREPFSDVYIHGTILDKQGRKMSKSLGNGIDPLAMIEGGTDENTKTEYEPHGADGVRFSLTTLSTEGQDLKLWPERFTDGQRFLTKLWNAGRFALGHLDGGEASVRPAVDAASLPLEDRWILQRLSDAVRETTSRLEGFRYCDAAQQVRSFAWDDFCDWYVEVVKFRFRSADDEGARDCRRVLAYTFDVLLRLLHPICPFITEELWSLLGARLPSRGLDGSSTSDSSTLIRSPWPEPFEIAGGEAAASTFGTLQEIVRRIRKIRQERNLGAGDSKGVTLVCSSSEVADELRAEAQLLRDLGSLEIVTVTKERPEAADGYAAELLSGIEVLLEVPAVDPAKERESLEKQRDEKRAYIARESKKLDNPSFVERAPTEVVDGVRQRLAEAEEQIRALEERLSGFDA